jgi:teichuronic acid exporter
MFSATDLGFFSRARSIQDVPSTTLANIVSRVTFPVFSTIQNDTIRLKKGMKKALTLLVFTNFPIMIGLALVARPLVLVILTDKWAPCIPYLRLLCLSMLLYPLHVINLNLLIALGRSDLFLKLEILKKILIVISIAVTWRWGIVAIIYGMISTSIIAYFINSFYTKKLIGYSVWAQLRDLLPSLTIAGLMGIAVYAAGRIPIANNLILLVVQVFVGVGFYVSACQLFQVPILLEIWQMIQERLPFLGKGCAR